MKKILAILLALVMMLAIVACGNKDTGAGEGDASAASDFKIGVILLHNDQIGYDAAHMEGVKTAAANLNIPAENIIWKYDIPEDEKAYDAAVDLAEQGCDIIFADSFGHESYIWQAASEYPDVIFCHATGTTAASAKIANGHNYFTKVYESRYVSGVVAGLKLKEMMAADSTIVPKMGYVGAFTFAEVMSGYTSFYLGAKSIVPEVTMDVKFTGSWYDEQKEKEAAQALIAGGCVLISQHADSMGAPTACETAGVPNVSYNGSTISACPNTIIVSSRIDWTPYFKNMIQCVIDGKAIDADWTGTIETGSVVLTEINEKAAAAGTAKKIEEVKAQLLDGTINVFDTVNWTVGGEKLTSYKADVDTDANFEKDTEAIENGVFYESRHRAAPYFDIRIDGIKLLDEKY